ncbi:MAG TPA: Crp/Fnr family transcriptional regulator [Candidatus Sulfotelmatobacter sp.]|nr:Crp/Fnr family transcriptional regulator [Candidatus Sulfotelmatobacter sp.]
MATNSSRRMQRTAPAQPDPQKIGNRILKNIGRKECADIFPSLEFLHLRLHQIVHEPGSVIHSVYFLNDGMASVLTVQSDGKSIEVGLIGSEGFVGVPVIFGFKTSATRVITQGDATAYCISSDVLRRVLPACPRLHLELQRFSQLLAFQSTQLAACNRLHGVEERMARWLLMSYDRIGNETMPLTQEFLAQMLGARRTSVSVAASILQKAGMITYTRGNVTIADLAKLRQAACDCYDIIQNQTRNWLNEAQ